MTAINLPDDVWAILHAMMNDDPVPLRTARQAIQAFEAAAHAAKQPAPASSDPPPPVEP
jgi:hypothetical protein